MCATTFNNIYIAAQVGRVEVVSVLVEAGADVNAAKYDGTIATVAQQLRHSNK